MTGAAAALLFDLDGTLVDSFAMQSEAYRRAFHELDLPWVEDRYRRVFGLRFDEAIPTMLDRGLRTSEAASIRAAKSRHLGDVVDEGVVTLPIASLLLASVGSLPIGLVTSASRSSVDVVLTALGWEKFFDVIVTGDDVSQAKPDPAPYTAAVRGLQLIPSMCLAFEDSELGVESARRAGVPVVMVARS